MVQPGQRLGKPIPSRDCVGTDSAASTCSRRAEQREGRRGVTSSPGVDSRPDSSGDPSELLVVRRLALPDDERCVAESAQRSADPSVPAAVRLELRYPEGPVPLRNRGARAPLMRVPVAPVDEDRPLLALVRDIGAPGQPLSAQAEPQPSRPERTSNQLFGARVALTDPAEPLGGLGIDDEIAASSHSLHSLKKWRRAQGPESLAPDGLARPPGIRQGSAATPYRLA